MKIEKVSADAQKATKRRHLPFPKKAVASIEGVPRMEAKKNLPTEMSRVLQKSLQSMGEDMASDIAHVFAPLEKRCSEEFKNGSLADTLADAGDMLGIILRDNPTFSSTIPVVLNRSNSGKCELVGSGVLIQILDRTFLLSAAHVFAYLKFGELQIPGKQGFMQVSGVFAGTQLPGMPERTEDKWDMAYCWLDDDCVNNLDARCLILEYPDAFLDLEPDRRHIYTFAGYPWRKGEAKSGLIKTQFQTLEGGEVKQSEYEAMGLKKSEHIIIRFNRKRAFNDARRRMEVAPLPSGMSGGGVHIWSAEGLKNWPVRLPLAGIANEFVPDRRLLIGVRLHVYVGSIFHNHPDLAARVFGPLEGSVSSND